VADGAAKVVDGMHNLEVAGASPAPATEKPPQGGFSVGRERQCVALSHRDLQDFAGTRTAERGAKSGPRNFCERRRAKNVLGQCCPAPATSGKQNAPRGRFALRHQGNGLLVR